MTGQCKNFLDLFTNIFLWFQQETQTHPERNLEEWFLTPMSSTLAEANQDHGIALQKFKELALFHHDNAQHLLPAKHFPHPLLRHPTQGFWPTNIHLYP